MQSASPSQDVPARHNGQDIIKPRVVGTAEYTPTSIAHNEGNPGYFKSAQWSPDGTCLITLNQDMTARTFVVPTDLLSEPEESVLKSYCSIPSPTTTQVVAIWPEFNLQNTTSTLILAGNKFLPIRLYNALTGGQAAVYPFVNPKLEKVLSPTRLNFTRDGCHFIAGGESWLADFDLSRNGEPPVSLYRAIPTRRTQKRTGAYMRGLISAMDTSLNGLMAVGTTDRSIALFSAEGRGEAVCSFKLGDKHSTTRPQGQGITQFLWSPCGNYFHVLERRNEEVIVFDIRQMGNEVGYLNGRKAMTQQRLDAAIFPTRDGYEIWTGGIDGKVQYWKDPKLGGRKVEPTHELEAHRDAVSSVALHPSGTVALTSSGQLHPELDLAHRHSSSDFDSENPSSSEHSFSEDDKPDETKGHTSLQGLRIDYSLKLWAL